MKIEKIKYTGKVYNLEVEPTHSVHDDQFYINADTGLVVHNCHPRDNIALRWLAKEYNLGYDMFDTVMHAREIQAQNLAQFLVEQAKQHGMSIVIHGKAYKPDVSYCIGSYSTLIGHYVKQAGLDVRYLDPLADDPTDVVTELAEPVVILWAHNRKITYKYTGNQTDTLPYCAIPQGSVIVDPWRKLPIIEGLTILPYGNSRNS